MTQYHKYLKDWTSERGITSFLGSDKPAFQQDWKEENKGLRFGEMESMGGEDINRAGEPFKKPKPKAKVPINKPSAKKEEDYLLDRSSKGRIIASPSQLGNQVVKETFFRIITADEDNFKTKASKTKIYNTIQKADAEEMASLILQYFNPNSRKRVNFFTKEKFLKDFFTFIKD